MLPPKYEHSIRGLQTDCSPLSCQEWIWYTGKTISFNPKQHAAGAEGGEDNSYGLCHLAQKNSGTDTDDQRGNQLWAMLQDDNPDEGHANRDSEVAR